MSLNLANVFFARATQQPSQLAIAGPKPEAGISYAELSQHIHTLAKQLHARGIRKDMNVGLHYPNSIDYIAFTYALWASGACVTPIPMELADEEKQQIMQHIAMDAVISPAQDSTMLQAFTQGASQTLTAQAKLYPIKALRKPPARLAALNPAFIRFTSGTTGDAKGVVLSHQTIYERIHAANDVLHIDSADRVVWLLSMAYHFAVSIVAYLTFGATIVLPQNAFGISILNAANQHTATLIYGAPTHYEFMTHDSSGQGLPDLRLAIVTTTRLSAAIADAFYQRFGLPLNETYGIIEVGLPAINIDQPRQKQGSVGKPLPAYKLKLLAQAEAESGEILLQGPGILDAYYDPWRERADILTDGWLATGDLGKLDEAGFLTLIGRSKELISVAGMKFFSQETEAVLMRHPAIQAACVFAVQSTRTGETPMAHLVLETGCTQPDIYSIKQHCQHHLASYKIPTEFDWVEKLAYTASGKLIRNAVKLLSPKGCSQLSEQAKSL